MKKRILVCAAFFYPHIGGYERHIYELYSKIADEFDVDILVSDCQNNPSFERLNGINVHRMESWGLLKGMYPIPKITINNISILRSILNKEYIFIHAHMRFFLSSFLGLLISRIIKTKLIHTEHGAGPVVFNNSFVNLISNIYDKIIGKMVIKGAYINIGVSRVSCNFLKGMGAERIYLLRNGVDINFFKKRETNLKKKLRISENYKIITFIGRLIYAKGVHDLIRCFISLDINSPVKLIIVGDGSYRENLERLSNKNKNIIFLGKRTDIDDILNITDILVNPSYSESFGLALAEANACAVPVITYEVGGVTEIVENNKNGFLVEIGDISELKEKIEFLLKNEDIAKEMGNYGRKKVEKSFNWDRSVNEFLNILKKYKLY